MGRLCGINIGSDLGIKVRIGVRGYSGRELVRRCSLRVRHPSSKDPYIILSCTESFNLLLNLLGITGLSEEDSTVRDTGRLIGRGDTSLVSGEGGAGCPAWDLVYGRDIPIREVYMIRHLEEAK